MNHLETDTWVVRLYRNFCNSIYGPLAPFYNLTSTLVSLGQWSAWRRLSLDFIKGSKVLEMGFGTGVLQREMLRRGLDAYGLEYSKDMHRLTQNVLNDIPHDSKRVLADGSLMPFASNSFESLVATFPEQYLTQEVTLKECERVLKPGGVLVIIGRWIELKSALAQSCFPVFYHRPSEEEVSKMQSLFRAANLEMKIELREMGFVRHRVILGYKAADRAD